MLYHKMTIVVLVSVFMFCVIVSAQDAPEENVQNEESQVADTNLEESPDEAIGDRIMEEMNGMKVYNCTKYSTYYLFHCKGKV